MGERSLPRLAERSETSTQLSNRDHQEPTIRVSRGLIALAFVSLVG
jgi:hypothetical protein